MNRLLKSAKANQWHKTVNIKSGMNITRDNKEAMIFDADNGNTNYWKDNEILKLKHIYNFEIFNSIGPDTSARITPGHTKIQVHHIYYYNQYGIYKALMWPFETWLGLTLTLTNLASSHSDPCKLSFYWQNWKILGFTQMISEIPT